MQKIVLVSDTHVACRGELVHKIDALGRLDLCVSTILNKVPDADLVVMMGDLVEKAGDAEYRAFLDAIGPLNIPVRFLVGNHDDRSILLALNPDIPVDENGYVQSRLDTEDGILLFLDTVETGVHTGEYGPKKQEWLRRELELAENRPVYLFMHHPPFATGFRTDNSRMREAEAFLSILSDSGSVRHLFVGHMHRAASGNWRGYSWSSLHGTCYENAFMMLPLQPDILSGPSQIGVAMLDQGDVVLHFHDIQEPYEVVGVRK